MQFLRNKVTSPKVRLLAPTSSSVQIRHVPHTPCRFQQPSSWYQHMHHDKQAKHSVGILVRLASVSSSAYELTISQDSLRRIRGGSVYAGGTADPTPLQIPFPDLQDRRAPITDIGHADVPRFDCVLFRVSVHECFLLSRQDEDINYHQSAPSLLSSPLVWSTASAR